MFFKNFKIALLFLIVILNSGIAYSLSVETHEVLNERLANRTWNGFSLDGYLKSNLGINGGINELFENKEVYKWLMAGGRYEDLPVWYLRYLRSVNHFHDPLASSLGQAGFTGVWGTGILSGKSAILWSQSALGAQSPGGHYSWYDVRDYYYRALSSPGQGARDAAFANTFCGLGQLMHLVQDMSVLEHARNDGHYANDWGAKI